MRRMGFACWIPTATGTHSEYVALLAFTRHQWLRERASMLRLQEVTCGTVAIIIRVFYFPHICAFVPFLCPPFITINHTAYILTEDDNTYA